MGKKENIVEGYLQRQAKKHGYLCPKLVSPSSNGHPDRMLIGHNQVIFVEAKSSEGSTRKLQDEVIKELRKHGATVYITSTREEVDTMFTEIMTSNK